MGLVAIEYTDLDAWQRVSGVELTPWEAETIRRMSREFVSQSHDSHKVECPSPWLAKLPRKQEVAEAMKNALRSLSKRTK